VTPNSCRECFLEARESLDYMPMLSGLFSVVDETTSTTNYFKLVDSVTPVLDIGLEWFMVSLVWSADGENSNSETLRLVTMYSVTWN
jgi:hypothetical protein